MAIGTGPLLRRMTSTFSINPASRPPVRAWMSVAVRTTPSRSSGKTMLVEWRSLHGCIVDGTSHVRTTPTTAKIATRLAAALKRIVLVEGIDMAFSGHPESAIFTLDVKARLNKTVSDAWTRRPHRRGEAAYIPTSDAAGSGARLWSRASRVYSQVINSVSGFFGMITLFLAHRQILTPT